jgi:hypothetical protein
VALGLSRPVSDYWKAFLLDHGLLDHGLNFRNQSVKQCSQDTRNPVSSKQKKLVFYSEVQGPFENENAAGGNLKAVIGH